LANGGNKKNEERKEESPFQPNKDRIYQYISNNPGCHLRKISKDLGLAMGDTQHHLKTLEKTDLIKSKRIEVFRRYYTVSIFGERLESLLAILGQEVPRDIILYLIENPGASQGAIAHYKDFSAPTINWHMSRLMEKGLVRSRKQGKFVNYYVEGNVKDITNILRKYYPSIWTKLSNRLADLFLDISSASSLQDNEIKEMTGTTAKKNEGKDDEQNNEEFDWRKDDENYKH
jgi:DNA-binding MarR family transcriptional regulator